MCGGWRNESEGDLELKGECSRALVAFVKDG